MRPHEVKTHQKNKSQHNGSNPRNRRGNRSAHVARWQMKVWNDIERFRIHTYGSVCVSNRPVIFSAWFSPCVLDSKFVVIDPQSPGLSRCFDGNDIVTRLEDMYPIHAHNICKIVGGSNQMSEYYIIYPQKKEGEFPPKSKGDSVLSPTKEIAEEWSIFYFQNSVHKNQTIKKSSDSVWVGFALSFSKRGSDFSE